MNKYILKTMSEVETQLRIGPVCSFDFETTGLDYMKMKPVGISFYDGENAFYIDLWENPEQTKILEFLKLSFRDRMWIAHNAKFDIKCCRKFLGTEPSQIFCTYIASYLLDENRPHHDLKTLAVEDLGVPEKDVKKWVTAAGYGYHSKEFYSYCHNDSIWAYHLWKVQQSEIEDQGLHHVVYDIEFPFIFVCVDMEINGVNVNMEKLDELKKLTQNKLQELEDEMADLAGLKIFIQNRMFGLEPERVMSRNLRSPEQLKKILKKLGFSVNDTKAKTIAGMKGKHPFIDCLIDYKKLRKLYDAYIIPTYEYIDSDGRVRCSFGIVKTGRTNCRNPNLQQLPNLNKRFSDLNYRGIFSSKQGYHLIGGDYSGQELRNLGEVSGDPTIISAFRENQDPHLVTANYIFDLGLSDKQLTLGTSENEEAVKTYKMERYRAKNGVNFPIVYGSSEYGISHNMGVEVAVAKEWKKKFFELYPLVKVALEDCRIELEDQGGICTLMGRKRRFPGFQTLPMYAYGKLPSKSRCIRQAFNFKIQGLSADQVKIAAVRARNAGLKILLIVHDEIVCEVDNQSAAGSARTLQDCMENAISLSVPFVVDVKTGNYYSELK